MTKTFSSGLIGLAVGDALGVPVEFCDREELVKDPVSGMRGYGTHHQPAGTWSDDTSLALAMAVSLAEKGLDYEDMMARFGRWYLNAEYTATGRMFDVGGATSDAITRHLHGVPALQCGGTGEHDNGNGSLMRILPAAAFFYKDLCGETASLNAMEAIHSLSGLTHAHLISKMGCGIFCCIAAHLLAGEEKFAAVQRGTVEAFRYYETTTTVTQRRPYDRVWDTGTLAVMPVSDIRSGGFVVNTLEAALWCLLTTGSFSECVLRAVNLGSDTDTTGAVAGGLAGICYGLDAIPAEWRSTLKRYDVLLAAGEKLDA